MRSPVRLPRRQHHSAVMARGRPAASWHQTKHFASMKVAGHVTHPQLPCRSMNALARAHPDEVGRRIGRGSSVARGLPYEPIGAGGRLAALSVKRGAERRVHMRTRAHAGRVGLPRRLVRLMAVLWQVFWAQAHLRLRSVDMLGPG